jgi:hypothetical protein
MLFLQLGFVILDGPHLVRTFVRSLLAQLQALTAEFGHTDIAAGLLTVISTILLVLPMAGLSYIVLRTVRGTFRQALAATRRRPVLRFPAVAVTLLIAAGLAAHWGLLPLHLGRATPGGHVISERPDPAPSATAARPGPAPSPTIRPIGRPAIRPAARPPAVVLEPVRAAGVGEDSVTAPLAIDQNPATAWHTQYYLGNPVFGGLKTGAGLILDMGRPVRISSVTVTFGPVPGADVSIEVGNRDTPTPGTFRTVASAADVGGTHTFKAARLTKGRYVLIWFTKLPPAGTGQFAVEVFGVTVRGWS